MKDLRVHVDFPSGGKILIAPDIHFPWANKEALEAFYALAKKLRPTFVIQQGDILDSYSFSRFARSLNETTPKQEIETGRGQALEFWKRVQKAAPGAKYFNLSGNHDQTRIVKRLMDKLPEFESLMEKPLADFLAFPGVQTLPTYRSELEIGTTMFVHGWGTRPGMHMNYFNQNTVIGHSHRAGIVYRAAKAGSLWEMACGHLADATSLPLSYTDTKTTAWTTGCGYIDELGPRFIQLP